ncbi:hypothetical protein FRX31_019300, partial [Thalictrum thalictroides]
SFRFHFDFGFNRSRENVAKLTPEKDFVLKVSALDLYSKTVIDLLIQDSSTLRLLDDPEKRIQMKTLDQC